MLSLAWQELRRRPGTLLGSIVMTATGAALITAFMAIHTSIDQTRAPVERYAGVPVVASGSPGMFTPQMVNDIAATDGVEDAVPELSFPVQILDGSGSPVVPQEDVAQFGHSWESAVLTPLELSEGAAPSQRDQIVIDQGLAQKAGVTPGANVPVDVGGVVHRFTVSGVARSPHSQLHQHGVFFTAAQASDLAGRGGGRVDAVGITIVPGAAPPAIEAEIRQYLSTALAGNVTAPSGLPDYHVASGVDRGEFEGAIPDHRATAQAMNMLVWIVVAMAIVVIAGALVSSVRRRAPQIALIRAVGAIPAQVRALCRAEALLVAAVASLAGVPVGLMLAWSLIAVVRTTGALSPVLTLHLNPSLLASAVLLVLLVTQIAAWWTARTALRTRPGDVAAVEAPTSRTRQRARVRAAVGGAAILAAGVVQAMGMAGVLPTTVMGTYGLIASLLIIVGVALLGSLLVRLFAVGARRPLGGVSPVSGYLAAANVGHHHRRYAGVTVPMTVGLALAGWAMVGLPLYALGNAHQFADRIDPQATVVDTPLVRDEHTGLTPQARHRIAHSDGVESTAGFWEGWIAALPVGTEPTDSLLTWGIVSEGEIAHQLHLGTIDGDIEAIETGRGVALARVYASDTGSAIGSDVQVRVQGASAVTTLPVVALYDGTENGDHGVIVAQRAMEQAVGSRWSDYILVSGSASVPSVAAALAPHTVGVRPHDQFVDSYVEGRSNLANSPGTIGVVLVGGFLILASVNALVLAHNDRLRELTALRRLNARPSEARRMVAWEMFLTVTPACLLGLVAVAWMAFSMAGADLSAAAWAYPTLPLVSFSVAALIITIVATLVVIRGLQRRIELRGRKA